MIVAVTLMLFGINICATDYDFLAPEGFCALGQVISVHQEVNNDWIVEITNINVLLQNSADNETLPEVPNKITFHLHTGMTGNWEVPNTEWIGRTALFSSRLRDGSYVSVHFPKLSLSWNQDNFVIFSPEEKRNIQWIEQVANILKMKDSMIRQNRLIELIESAKTPIFIKNFSIGQFAVIGSGKTRVHLVNINQ